MLRLTIAFASVLLAAPVAALARGETSVFYYPWYGTPKRDGGYLHWNQGGHVPPADLASSYYPTRGPYSSSDQTVLRAQMHEIAQAGVSEVISSWWGWGSPEDLRLPSVVRVARAQGIRVAVQIEPYANRTASTVDADIGHLRGLGVGRFYVYHPWDVPPTEWAPLLGELRGVEVFAQTATIAWAAAAQFNGVYTYDLLEHRAASFAALCAKAHTAGLTCAPSVGPGYDALRATGDPRILPRRRGKTYDAMWQAALEAGADRVTVTSYNEWHEGTQIEPAAWKRGRGLASSPVARAYVSYDGAYGLRGRESEPAYLARTAYWTNAYRLAAEGGQALRSF